jgi:hypothetical protein
MTFIGNKPRFGRLTATVICCLILLILLRQAHSQMPDDLDRRLIKHGHALLIGVSNYEDTRWNNLDAVPAQIRELQTGLAPHFEDVDILMNPTVTKLRSVLEEFFRKFGDDEDGRLFVFYFGHGFTDENLGNGYRIYYWFRYSVLCSQ